MVSRAWFGNSWGRTLSRVISSSFSIGAGIASRSYCGSATAGSFGTRSKCKTTPILSSLQKSADTPIISLAGLLRLAEWIQDYLQLVQGGDPCHEAPQSSHPPAPARRQASGARPTLESADGRTASTNAGNPQRHRAPTARRASRPAGGAR